MARTSTLLALATLLALPARAEDPAPALKWRGSLWAVGAVSDKTMADGSLLLRPMEPRDGQFNLDGLQLGADLALGQGWTFKVTLLAGRAGQLLQEFSAESGTMGLSEAMLVWAGGKETVKVGRMWTWMGMEATDLTTAIPASHGLMATFPLPFGQIGVDWRHAFTPSWSTAVWVYNGEDRNRDNNHGKTAGLGLIYNHGGAQDKFLNLSVFSGAEQDGLNDKAKTGAEGRKRERISHSGQWVWGATTMVWEAEYLKERFAPAMVAGATGPISGTLKGAGLVLKRQWNAPWSSYVRLEQIQDDLGFRLNFDTTLAQTYGMRAGADLTARSISVGSERRWGAAFGRLELRRDWLNRDVADQDGKTLRAVNSVTFCVGANFGL